jgi:8-hydroxy-5-deazaflavin:NADPH oxidoreductase
MMKIGILGAGVVGQSFARALVPHGHSIILSSRTPDSPGMQQIGQAVGAQVGTVADTIAFGDTIAVALRWDAVPQVMRQGDWSGKVIIDMTNRFGGEYSQSAAQDMAELAPGGHVVKAFNTIGAEHYLNPVFDGRAATLFIAGDNPEAKRVVQDLAEQMGFEVIDAGDLAISAHLEALAAFWVHLAYRTSQGRNVAFKLLRR